MSEGSTFDNVVLVDEGREDQNTTISVPPLAHMAFRWWAINGPTLNAVW